MARAADAQRQPGMHAPSDFERLLAFLERLPAIQLPAGRASIGYGRESDGTWWVKFGLDLAHPSVWRVVQEIAHVLNYLSLEERLPAVFKPVSPPPYMNGGPDEFLSWVVEGDGPEFTPDDCAEWLEGRLPSPVDDPAQWIIDDTAG